MANLYKDLLLSKISYKEYLEKSGFNYSKPQLTSDTDIITSWVNDPNKNNYVPIVDFSTVEGYKNVTRVDISEYDFFTLWEEGIGFRHPDAPYITELEYSEEILNEAIERGASDLTMYSLDKKVYIKLNIRGKHVDSKISVPIHLINNIITVLTKDDISTFSWQVGIKDGECTINDNWMGRYSIQKLNEKDLHLTIRLQQTGKFNKNLEDLNLSKSVYDFINNEFIKLKNEQGEEIGGLRLVCGKPSSGKNWTILGALGKLVKKNIYKVMYIGMPPETVLDGMIPVNCATEEMSSKAVQGLNRQAASFGYIAEITEINAKDSIIAANKGIPIYGTIHCNTAADVILRFMLITGYSADIVLQSLHCVIHQNLVDDDTLALGRRPRCTYILFDDELKSKCFGKSVGEIYVILKNNTKGDI